MRAAAFLALVIVATVARADSPAMPVGLSSVGFTTGTLNGRYLRLDASNDPLTGQLQVQAGTAAAPGLVWVTGGLTTGFFSDAAQTLKFSSAGTARLLMDQSQFAPAVTATYNLGTTTLQWGQIFASAGSAATPSLNFGGATATGLYGGATGVGFTVAGGAEASISATEFSPVTDGGNQLGSATNQWKQLSIQPGAAATPSVIFGGATATGLYGSTTAVGVTIAGASKYTASATDLSPAANDAQTLGTSLLGYNKLYVGSSILGTGTAKALTIDGGTNTGVTINSGGSGTVQITSGGASSFTSGAATNLTLASGTGGLTINTAATGSTSFLVPQGATRQATSVTMIGVGLYTDATTAPTCAVAGDAGKVAYFDKTNDLVAGVACICAGSAATPPVWTWRKLDDLVTACTIP